VTGSGKADGGERGERQQATCDHGKFLASGWLVKHRS
jgi:hypothetical protein